jgi:hypothetical protein
VRATQRKEPGERERAQCLSQGAQGSGPCYECNSDLTPAAGPHFFDRVVADTKDVVAGDCEMVLLVHGSKAEVRDQEDAFFKSLPPAQREFWNTFEEQLAPFPNA